ncbi:hypothetical protein FQZ97_758590 [compost metagenome]
MFLPKELEVLTGFILRPAVKTGVDSRERKKETDQHSTQIDIIVYNTARYPVFQRFGNNVVVPPEGVVAAISVKKHLRIGDVKDEGRALLEIAKLCRTLSTNKRQAPANRGPFLALIGIKSKIESQNLAKSAFTALKKIYTDPAVAPSLTFDDMMGFVGSFDSFSLLKPKPQAKALATSYVGFNHSAGDEHYGFQFLLTGILSVYYDDLRNHDRRPGFTAFPARPANYTSTPVSFTAIR